MKFKRATNSIDREKNAAHTEHQVPRPPRRDRGLERGRRCMRWRRVVINDRRRHVRAVRGCTIACTIACTCTCHWTPAWAPGTAELPVEAVAIVPRAVATMMAGPPKSQKVRR